MVSHALMSNDLMSRNIYTNTAVTDASLCESLWRNSQRMQDIGSAFLCVFARSVQKVIMCTMSDCEAAQDLHRSANHAVMTRTYMQI